MKLLLTFTLLVFVASNLLAQATTTSPNEESQSVVLSEEGDGPVILFDKREISQGELSAMDQSQIGNIEILSGDEAEARFGKYKKNGAIVISSSPPADVIPGKIAQRTPITPAEHVNAAREEEVQSTPVSELNAYIVIDGKPSTMEVLQAMNPAQIESMEVLKGAAATDKYGAAAKDGAIEVTTKQ